MVKANEKHPKGLGEPFPSYEQIVERNRILEGYLQEIGDHANAIARICDAAKASQPPQAPGIFHQRVDSLPLSVRTSNFLKNANVRTVAGIVRITEEGLIKTRLFGRKSIRELVKLLGTQGLRLGMTQEEVFAWVPPNPKQPLFPEV